MIYTEEGKWCNAEVSHHQLTKPTVHLPGPKYYFGIVSYESNVYTKFYP